MQLAGKLCEICQKGIVFDSDAKWCSRCSTIFHKQCIAMSSEICPVCNRICESPERHFVFSQQCPECFRVNKLSQAQCGFCGARTRWDTDVAYNEFLAHMKDTSRVCMIKGIAEIFGGMFCVLAIISMLCLTQRPAFLGLGLFLFGFVTFSADGLVNLMRSRRIGRFR